MTQRLRPDLRPRAALLAASTIAALAACSPPDNEGSPEAGDFQAAAPQAAAENPAAAPGAPILLETLSETDLAQNQLDGELSCAFAASRGDEPLFFGAGNVVPEEGAQGLVKVDGSVSDLAMEGAGGFDRMSGGARFGNGELTAQIEVTGEEALPEDPPIAGESPLFTARFVVEREGRSIAVDGFYECGP